MSKVGFVGLGHMGGPMARNLARAGHLLQVFDIDEETMAMATNSVPGPAATCRRFRRASSS